jgi:hypothetical protein
MATLITTTGEVREVQPTNAKTFSLEELQAFVGGYIEEVRLNGQIMFVNEEGLLDGLKANRIASLEARRTIVGDVVICRDEEVE